MISVEDELKKDLKKRWQAIGMLKHVLASLYLPWQLKKHAISILLCITDGNVSKNCDDEDSEYMPSVFAALQVLLLPRVYSYLLMYAKLDDLIFLIQNYISGYSKGHHVCARYRVKEECI